MIWFKTLWEYRYFIATSVRSDFRGRLSRSRLGFLWLVMSPLSQVLIYALVLSSLMTARLPDSDNSYSYAIYLTASFQCWLLFIEIVNRSLTMFIENANVLKKIAFPRVAIPIIVVISSLINNLIFLAILIVFYFLVGQDLWAIGWLPVLLLLNILFSTGLGMILGILNVFIRDIGQFVQIVLQFLFWLTPIVYGIDVLPPRMRLPIYLNPLYWVMDCYHRVLVYDRSPDPVVLLLAFLGSLCLVTIGFWLFRKSSAEMVDVL